MKPVILNLWAENEIMINQIMAKEMNLSILQRYQKIVLAISTMLTF